jgi:F0F1-type ATP synthase assembly protein I
MELFPPEDYPKVTGIVVGFSSLSGILAPYVLGYILDVTHSFNVAYYTLSVVSLVGAGCGFLIVRAERKLHAQGAEEAPTRLQPSASATA